ncbi:MAG: phosphorylase [Methylicorpusculum sp.]|uniref:phosphorylase family protein n=1 Tax=Methylicorpusculum sp. TaxID=2713644 RepID=UPI0027285A03|nr:phosphorylase [Methylicorpusculum sp.]MDO8846467.1 phosphorylase [Methylicorpusculum sp.]MDO8939437.1 phosphorylase [Methylicorpusculum sp.]MDO9241905.1 phosphorylase [Methylicorpusculum sp.]MDP2179626.1 phosphorylase [Methylicorpusculum sp.]MDP2200670.1 phosphorylase [Methylicorpusculum sp.]
MITGIVVALPEELSTLTSQKLVKGCCHSLNETTLLCLSGTGPENAARTANQLISNGANRLVSWGCAAALHKACKPGDLILPDRLVSDNSPPIFLNSPWLEETRTVLQAINLDCDLSGTLAESAHIVSTALEKKGIAEQMQAKALDMESYAIAQVANQYELPCLVVRAIADPASMDLPKAISFAIDKQGEVVLTRLLCYLMTHPNEIPSLIRLGKDFSSARKTLQLAAKKLNTFTLYAN